MPKDAQVAAKMVRFAKIHLRNMESEQGVKLLKEAMRLGSGEACYLMGTLSLSGRHVDENKVEGYNYMLRGAERGFGLAMGMASHCLKHGIGTKVDNRAAAEWALDGAEAGDVMATRLMADMCYSGVGFQKDHELALQYYRIAASGGDRDASRRVKEMISRGEGR